MGDSKLNVDQVKADSVGRWPGIFSHFGVEVGTGKHCPCPSCGGEDRFRFDDLEGKGTWFCNQCGAGDGISLLIKVLGMEFIEVCKEVEKIVGTVQPSKHQKEKTVSPELFRRIYKASREVEKGDEVHAYLKSRGLSSMPSMLRCGPCWEPETKQEQTAMLAVFSLPDGEAVTMHRTFLRHGMKLDIEKPKKFLPNLKPLAGGAIRLYESGDVLGVAEGIETAIACKQNFDMPVWATIGTAMMTSFDPPRGVEKVTVFSDNDENFAGQKAAYALANRLVIEKKLTVEVVVPDLPGDFLDEINKQEGKDEQAIT